METVSFQKDGESDLLLHTGCSASIIKFLDRYDSIRATANDAGPLKPFNGR
jgi:hypothetical protein